MKIMYSALLMPYPGASLGRVTAWVSFSVILYVATIVSADNNSYTAIADHLQGRSTGNFDLGLEQPCPHADDIIPCHCSYSNSSKEMLMDCSTVESEEQLRQVFKAYFPVIKFKQFFVSGNPNLKVLETNVFGNISFEAFVINHSAIEIIEKDAFKSSYETATSLNFNFNNIKSFPFNDMKNFYKLNFFGIGGNSLDLLPLDAFHGLSSLEGIYLPENDGTFTGDFQNIPNLKNIYLSSNNLSTIPPNFFKTGSPSLRTVTMNHCEVVSVEPNAFEVVGGLLIRLEHNLLTTLDEATWRPLFEGGVELNVWINPLNCGCDLAWLYGEDHLLDYVQPDATCIDGEYLYDLDPKIFDDC